MANARARIATKLIDPEAGTVTFDFTHGESSVYALSDLPAHIQTQLALHGISQKGGDSYSGEKEPREAKASADEVWARLVSGEWVVRRQRSEGSVTLTIEAVAALQNRTTEEIFKIWENLDDETKKEVRADPGVKAKMAEIKAIRLAEKAREETGDGGALGLFAAA
jgi:hypothetical protein